VLERIALSFMEGVIDQYPSSSCGFIAAAAVHAGAVPDVTEETASCSALLIAYGLEGDE
jgi:hypothetical protein